MIVVEDIVVAKNRGTVEFIVVLKKLEIREDAHNCNGHKDLYPDV